MYGTNGMGSVLSASATIVGSTAGVIFLINTNTASYIKFIAYASYALILLMVASFAIKKVVARKMSRR